MELNVSNSSMGSAGVNMTAGLDTPHLLEAFWFHPVILGIRRLLYIVSPSETTFETIEEAPGYFAEGMPYYVLFVTIEMCILALQGKPLPRWNDSYGSTACGLMSLLPMIVVRNIEMTSYVWAYENFCLIKLPWNSMWTWWAAFLAADLAYYFMHRASHEVNFFWAAHQVHHSSQEYNVTTAMRQSLLRRYIAWIFNVPFALFIPPSVFLVHMQFNLIGQLWMHTEAVGSLGPLEYIFNTPSNHRVHHGTNRYCIDKNYGGMLIIWDRLFGTYVKEGERIAYGVTTPIDTWDPVEIQLGYWKYMWDTIWSRDSWSDRWSTIWKGPGWSPGKPRTGYLEDIPDAHYPMPKYDKQRPLWLNVYCWSHLLMSFAGFHAIERIKLGFDPFNVFLFMIFMFWTVSNLGFIFEDRGYAPVSELARCLTFLVADFAARDCGDLQNMTLVYIARIGFIISANLWLAQCAQQWKTKSTKTE